MPSKDVIFKGKVYWDNDPIPPDPTPPSSDTLTVDDFEFLGSYRIDRDNAALFTFAYGGITGRKVNGKTRIFITINENSWHGSLLEFQIPDAPPSLDWTTSPQLTRVRWWGDIYGGRRGTYMQVVSARKSLEDLQNIYNSERNPDIITKLTSIISHLKDWVAANKSRSGGSWQWYEFPPSQSVIAALYWDEVTKRVFWTYFDVYNVSGRPDWGLGATELHDDTPEGDVNSFTADGPWRLAVPVGGLDNGQPVAGWTAYGPWRGLGIVIRPDTNELLTCSSIMSGNAGSPWGNDCYGGGILPVKGHPSMEDVPVQTCYLEHYPMLGMINSDGVLSESIPLRSQKRIISLPVWENIGTSAMNINNEIYGYDSWREVDGSGILLWINNINGKSGLVFLGNACNGHEWYSNPGNNFKCPSHQVPAPVMITGPVSTSQFAAMWIYKLEDVFKVSRKEIPDYSPEPEEINLTEHFGIHGSWPEVMGGNNAIAGTYFDKEERLLYLMSPKADNITVPPELGPVIHVFRVGGPTGSNYNQTNKAPQL